jgi:hypothetical protein
MMSSIEPVDASDTFSTVQGQQFAVDGKITIGWVGENRQGGVFKLPTNRNDTLFYVASGLTHDLIFGQDTINEYNFFGRGRIFAGIPKRVAVPPNPVHGKDQ